MIFESLDTDVIRAAALRVNGAVSPSGLDPPHISAPAIRVHQGTSVPLLHQLP